jgi:hypothetical protein
MSDPQNPDIGIPAGRRAADGGHGRRWNSVRSEDREMETHVGTYITRFCAALAIALLAFASPAYAERDHPIYEGLLPPHFQMQEGAPLTAADLAGKHIALVPSANFNAFAARLQNAHGNALVSEATIRDYLEAVDPRKFTDRVVMLLAPYGAQVTAARDFADAHAQGADYICVLDMRVSSSLTGGTWSVRYGIYALDASLHHVFSSVQTGRGQYHDPGLFAGANQTIVASDTATIDAARQASAALAQDVTAKLGPPPAATGDNHAN